MTMETTWARDEHGIRWLTFRGCRFADTDCTRELIDEIERLQRELTRAHRIAGKADRMYDAIDNLRNYATDELRLESIRACKTAAHEYDAAMSDTQAEDTDTPALCRRCEREIDSGHDRG